MAKVAAKVIETTVREITGEKESFAMLLDESFKSVKNPITLLFVA